MPLHGDLSLVARLAQAGAGTDIAVRRMEEGDWQPVSEIYRQGIASGNVTFETDVPSWEAFIASRLGDHRLVAVSDGVLGWAALSPFSDRCVYAGVAETSVYVAEEARGGGVGQRLLEALIADSEGGGIWTLQAGMFPENGSSVRLHLRCGFRIVGHRERIGQLGGRWRDVLLLERRSAVTGQDER